MARPFPCFIHIEKCAGTSLHHMLHHAYPGYLTLDPQLSAGQTFTPGQLRTLRRWVPGLSGIGGHRVRCYENYGEVLPGYTPFYFTFLRDPISRYMSHLNYQINAMGVDWTLESFLEHEHFRDFQTFRIAGERDLNKAKEFLTERIAFAGLMESYDLSLLLLRDSLGDSALDLRYVRENVGSGGTRLRYEDLSSSHQEQVRQRNLLDLELYSYAKETLFPQYQARYRGDLQSDLETLRGLLQGFRYPPASVMIRKVRHLYVNRVLKSSVNMN